MGKTKSMSDPIVTQGPWVVIETVNGYATHVFAVAATEARKLLHDPWDPLSRAIQPVLWLLLFGAVMAQVHGITPAGVRYLDFLTPGILAQSVFFVSIFYGISAIWERDLGVLHRYLVSPAPRSALILGKALSSSMRALSQAVMVYTCAAVLGVQLSLLPLHVAIVVLLIALSSALFSTFSLIIACLVKTRDRFMGVGQVLTMPIFFASNAIYPIALMPPWLKVIARANPLTYEVDGLRAMMLANGVSALGLGMDFFVLLIVLTIFVVIATRLYPRLTQ